MKSIAAKSLIMALMCAGFAGVLALGGCASGSNSAASSSAASESAAASSTASESTAASSAAASSAASDSASASAAAAEASAAASSAAGESADETAYDETDCMLIALEDAGAAVNSCMITETGIDKSSGTPMYTIEFYTDDMEYEYAINMNTGEIMAADAEPRDAASTSGGTNAATMSADDAKAIIFQTAGVNASEVTITDEEFTNSYGKELYTLEFETATMEYEYALDLATGEIFAADSEPK